jgi:glucosamine-6-phosphate deaminase
MMKVVVENDYDGVSKKVAGILIQEIKSNPNIILGLATGSTTKGMYLELINSYKTEGVDFSGVRTFNLDEYIGLNGDHPQSYRSFMDEYLFNHINIDKNNTLVPSGIAEDIDRVCREYDKKIEDAGGIDLQILGVGENGHIAFNEPGDHLNINTSVVKLTDSTIRVNSRFFNSIDEMPRTAITMGIGSILKARKLILLATGKKKRPVIKQLLENPVASTYFPVSMLLCHPDLTIIVDRDAYVD